MEVKKYSYHDLYITTKDIPRTSIFNLPYNLIVTCSRIGGWELWDRYSNHNEWTDIAGEYSLSDKGLILDIDGFVIVDSINKKGTDDENE